MRLGFVIKEEETCCAGLAGICLGWGVPACPGACFEEAQGCSPAPWAIVSGWVEWCFSMLAYSIGCRLLPGNSALDMQMLAWVFSYAKWAYRNVVSSFIKQLEI